MGECGFPRAGDGPLGTSNKASRNFLRPLAKVQCRLSPSHGVFLPLLHHFQKGGLDELWHL